MVTSSAFRLSNHGELTPPALVRACSPADGIATFPVHERTFVKSGGREPAVGRITRVQRCSAAKHRQSPACWRHCSYKRVLRTTGVYAPRSCVARIRARLRFPISPAWALSQHGGLTRPLLYVATSTFAGGIATFAMHKRTFVKSGGRQPAVVRESHRQPRLRSTRAVAGAASAVFGAIAAVPLQMRYREPRGAYADRPCGGRR